MRGSGRFKQKIPPRRTAGECFNPLHCGAVVASPRREARRGRADRVSIPFIAGQWSLPTKDEDVRGQLILFQSPSLRGSGRFKLCACSSTRWKRRFNPLHCGAVVASMGQTPPPPARGGGFNPLHCGAVVASGVARTCHASARRVSIPFIAGQWSLRDGGGGGGDAVCRFQSPSLRGSGRFPKGGGDPFALQPVSIPFIAGQWSLRKAQKGSGIGRRVSIPFIAGQWSLRGGAGARRRKARGFNPLHCGAVVASSPKGGGGQGGPHVSIPFIAGQWSLRVAAAPIGPTDEVSIPFIAGQWSLLPRTTPSSLFGVLLRKRRLPCDHIICTRLPF